ncbi:hypothetical protein C4J99_3081 [Pseudomonas synxantha]|nr:hypothetical protein C4J99_3081 [Pseudomonas synxantha]
MKRFSKLKKRHNAGNHQYRARRDWRIESVPSRADWTEKRVERHGLQHIRPEWFDPFAS